mmetsp:Transcript_28809/g.88133  ORF Transcript_28809/g.88133 Transcript_28809/m.88133 type:complete len:213 (-) Transcript_28809:586-1224(-)
MPRPVLAEQWVHRVRKRIRLDGAADLQLAVATLANSDVPGRNELVRNENVTDALAASIRTTFPYIRRKAELALLGCRFRAPGNANRKHQLYVTLELVAAEEFRDNGLRLRNSLPRLAQDDHSTTEIADLDRNISDGVRTRLLEAIQNSRPFRIGGRDNEHPRQLLVQSLLSVGADLENVAASFASAIRLHGFLCPNKVASRHEALFRARFAT